MDNRAAAMLKRTFFALIPQIFSRLLQKPERYEIDLESQVRPSRQTLKDEAFAATSRLLSEDLAEMDHVDYQDSGYCPGPGKAQEGAPYAEGPARVFVHKDGESEDCLALFVNEEMVSRIQEVANRKEILRKHEKAYAELVDKISSTERDIGKAEESLAHAESEDQGQDFEQEIQSRKLELEGLTSEMDIMVDRLKVFRMNVDLTKDEAQAFFEQVLGDAHLLADPDKGSLPTSCEPSRANSGSSLAQCHDDTGDNLPDVEELHRKTAWEKLIYYSNDLRETQEQFDTWPDACDRERKAYDDLLANGEVVPARSEHDRFLLCQSMRITSYLVNVEKDQERAKEHAIALGIIDEDWGKPTYYGDEFDAQSWTADEEISYQKTKDWSHIEGWRQKVSTALAGTALQPMGIHDCEEKATPLSLTVWRPMDVDDWDAKTIEFAQDSVSVVAQDEYQSRNISRWQEMRGHR